MNLEHLAVPERKYSKQENMSQRTQILAGKGSQQLNLEIFEQNNDSSGYIIILNEVIHEFTLINK